MNYRVLQTAFLAVGVLACGEETEPFPSWAIGTFHLEGGPDVTNLRIEQAGTFDWVFDGCDTRANSTGRATRISDDTVELLPPDGATGFVWSGHFNEPVDRVHVASVDGEVISNAGSRRDTWLTGGLCARCVSLCPSSTTSVWLGPCAQDVCEPNWPCARDGVPCI